VQAVVLADIFVLQEITYLFFVLRLFDKLTVSIYSHTYLLTYSIFIHLFTPLLLITSGPVSTGMGDRARVQFSVPNIYLCM